ncbi:MAG: hypothetical protein H7Y36_00460, partial [Armatimonadetes bacterium]|nr:hypothetical protein [Akkermansiaceae bacterium]
MSRRGRRAQGSGNKPWLGKLVVAAGATLLLVSGIGYMGLRAYLHSEGFRKFLSAEVSRAAKVKGFFAPFSWDGLAVETASFAATGEGMVSEIKADQIETEIGFGGLGRGVWEIKATRINHLDISLTPEKHDAPPPVQPELRKQA